MNKNKLILTGCILAFITMCYGAFAVFNDTIQFDRKLHLESVQIDLVQEVDHFEKVLPTEHRDYPVYVINNAEPCYIRIKEPDLIEMFTLDINEMWIYINGYYYYKDVVQTDEKIDFCKSITFANWDDSNQDTIHSWNLIAEAVQSDNFDYDLTKDDPFNGTDIIAFPGNINQEGF